MRGEHFSPIAKKFLKKVRLAKIANIDGIIKSSVPNRIRHSTDTNSPQITGSLFFLFNHCSRRITTNIAVITNSIPSVEKNIKFPNTFITITPFREKMLP